MSTHTLDREPMPDQRDDGITKVQLDGPMIGITNRHMGEELQEMG